MPIILPDITTPSEDSYLTVPEADELAETLPATQLAAWLAATDAAKANALNQATIDVDRAMSYQGRRYDLDQAREFPRVAYEHGSGLPVTTPYPSPLTPDVIWDWDATNNVAIVPPDVERATLHQANSILAADREDRLNDTHDGVSGQSADGLSESYGGKAPVLCRRAHELMGRYRLKMGPMI